MGLIMPLSKYLSIIFLVQQSIVPGSLANLELQSRILLINLDYKLELGIRSYLPVS